MTTVAIWLSVVTVLTFGIVRLFVLRFEIGDVYPPYSSLRSDPLGAKALHDSLSECEPVSVERSYVPVRKLRKVGDCVVFVLGGHRYFPFYGDQAKEYRQFAVAGGRLVMSFLPQSSTPTRVQKDRAPEDKRGSRQAHENDFDKKSDTTDDGGPESDKEHDKESSPSDKLWDVGFSNAPITSNSFATLTADFENTGLPRSISCHSAVCFKDLDEPWKAVYARKGRAVIVERTMGKGSIVLSTISYPFSNEALVKERHTSLLTWFVGGKTRAVFDEFHHGIARRPGVATLAREYRLHWLLAGIVLLGILFVWKNASRLVMPCDAGEDWSMQSGTEGKDAASGLKNLLKRNISPRNLLETCLDEWKRSSDTIGAGSVTRIEHIKNMIGAEHARPAKKQDFARLYNDICTFLKT